MTGLFGAQVSVFNSERQAIWQRYNAMLIANSFILAFSGRAQPALWAIVGICLCFAWAILTWSGFRFFFMQMTELQRFKWPGPPEVQNPIEVSFRYRQSRDWIYWMALSVIALFSFAYLYVLIFG